MSAASDRRKRNRFSQLAFGFEPGELKMSPVFAPLPLPAHATAPWEQESADKIRHRWEPQPNGEWTCVSCGASKHTAQHGIQWVTTYTRDGKTTRRSPGCSER